MDDTQSITYNHTTSLNNLRKMLDSGGRIKSLRHIALESPNAEISVEPFPIPIRDTMKAKDAYELMKDIKAVDKVFFTRNGYLPNYGDVVISKKFGNSVKPHEALNSIPEEFTTRRAVSLRNKAKIYIPDEDVDVYKKAYPNYRILPKSLLPVQQYGFTDRVSALASKIKNKVSGLFKEGAEHNSDSKYKRLFGRNARLVGSEALGINVPGSSDTDVFIPYKRQGYFNRALTRIGNKYPDLHINSYSAKKPDKKTFTGSVNGNDMDVVVAYGPRAERFRNAFERAMEKLTDKRRTEIIKRKQELKNSWFFPETRYKWYKKDLAKELGLADAYF